MAAATCYLTVKWPVPGVGVSAAGWDLFIDQTKSTTATVTSLTSSTYCHHGCWEFVRDCVRLIIQETHYTKKTPNVLWQSLESPGGSHKSQTYSSVWVQKSWLKPWVSSLLGRFIRSFYWDHSPDWLKKKHTQNISRCRQKHTYTVYINYEQLCTHTAFLKYELLNDF